MVLEAFWSGDRDTVDFLTDDEVGQSFISAIDAREERGETLEHRLVRIEDAKILEADYRRPIARVTIQFDADIAASSRLSAVASGTIQGAVGIAFRANAVSSARQGMYGLCTSQDDEYAIDGGFMIQLGVYVQLQYKVARPASTARALSARRSSLSAAKSQRSPPWQ